MSNFSDALKKIRIERGLSQRAFATILNLTQQGYARYENGTAEPNSDTLALMARYFNVPVAEILGINEQEQQPKPIKGIRIPVLGIIPAGIPIEAIEDIVDYEELHPDAYKGDRKFFGLRVRGDSMAPEIQDGSTVIVRQQEVCESGDVCVVLVDGLDATLKRIRLDQDGIYLVPSNPGYQTEFFSNEKIKKLPVRVLGVVYEVRFAYKKI